MERMLHNSAVYKASEFCCVYRLSLLFTKDVGSKYFIRLIFEDDVFAKGNFIVFKHLILLVNVWG